MQRLQRHQLPERLLLGRDLQSTVVRDLRRWWIDVRRLRRDQGR
jgi:hypothetical protein